MNKDDGILVLSEFKTRKSKRLPGRSQKATHDFQVMMYKHLVDKIIAGEQKAEEVWEALRLDPKSPFGEEFLLHLSACLTGVGKAKFENLHGLWREATEQAQFLPKVAKLKVEYCFQVRSQSKNPNPIEFSNPK